MLPVPWTSWSPIPMVRRRVPRAFTYSPPETFNFNGTWKGWADGPPDSLVEMSFLDRGQRPRQCVVWISDGHPLAAATDQWRRVLVRRRGWSDAQRANALADHGDRRDSRPAVQSYVVRKETVDDTCLQGRTGKRRPLQHRQPRPAETLAVSARRTGAERVDGHATGTGAIISRATSMELPVPITVHIGVGSSVPTSVRKRGPRTISRQPTPTKCPIHCRTGTSGKR